MSVTRTHYLKTAVRLLTAVIIVYSANACRPIKIDKSNKPSSITCQENTISVGDTCIKDGFIYLLQDAIPGKIESSSGKTIFSFGKQTLVKGDKLFATARLTFAKGASASKSINNFQIGSTNVGSASTQFLGENDSVSVVRHSVTHQVSESAEAPVTLSWSQAGSTPAQVDGTLLIFRQTQVAYALDSKVQKQGMPPYFAADTLDSDKLNTKELKVSATATDLAEVTAKNIKANDILLIRSGSAWNVAEGKANACEGATLSWTLTLDQKEIGIDGPHTITTARSIGSASFQSIVKVPSTGATGRLALAAKLTAGSGADRNNCVLQIAEPTTISALVFRPLSELPGDIQNARYLHDLGVVSSEPTKLVSHPSGPPIQTILSLNWEHVKGDALLIDANVNVAAEDRIQSTKAFLQLSRAPDGLSSHVSKTMLIDPEKPRGVVLTDMAIEQEIATQTRFYLTGMAYNNDSRSVLINDAKIFFMHFRRIGDRL